MKTIVDVLEQDSDKFRLRVHVEILQVEPNSLNNRDYYENLEFVRELKEKIVVKHRIDLSNSPGCG